MLSRCDTLHPVHVWKEKRTHPNQMRSIKCVSKSQEGYHPSPTQPIPISCVASNVCPSPRNVIILRPAPHPVRKRKTIWTFFEENTARVRNFAPASESCLYVCLTYLPHALKNGSGFQATCIYMYICVYILFLLIVIHMNFCFWKYKYIYMDKSRNNCVFWFELFLGASITFWFLGP